jgi:thiamine biosynthesis lipoprotein
MLARALWLVACLLLAACSREPLTQREAFVFGTRVEVQIYGAPAATAEQAAAAVLREFDRLHTAFHAWQPSELTRINEALAGGEPARDVSPELISLLKKAQQLAADSDESFNPALGQLIAAWGFHADTFPARLPDAARVAALVAQAPRMADLVIHDNRIESRNRAVQLDLGGIAKGYALDRAAAILRQQGVRHALINIGGNVMALGQKGAQPWRVGIAHPRGTGALGTLALRDGEAIGTSGDYQRYFEVDGKRYCHVLDPRSGYPAISAQAVTVLIPPGPDAGLRSDATSKPIFIANDARWRDEARKMRVTQVLRVDAQGGIEASPALAERIEWMPGVRPRAWQITP